MAFPCKANEWGHYYGMDIIYYCVVAGKCDAISDRIASTGAELQGMVNAPPHLPPSD